jgi:cytochrome c5
MESSMKSLLVLVALLVAGPVLAERVPPGTTSEIAERLKPFGEMCKEGQTCGQATAGAAGGGTGLDGKGVYDKFCFACHATGVGGAPKHGDKAAWAPHVAKGVDTMWQSVLNGLNAMPPKGTCMSCSEDELKAAMNYLLDAAK